MKAPAGYDNDWGTVFLCQSSHQIVQIFRQCIFLRREVFGLAFVLSFGLLPVRRTPQVNFSQRVYKLCCQPVAVMTLYGVSTMTAFDILSGIGAIICQIIAVRSLSWWPWTQAPTWTLCPSLTIQMISVAHAYAAFILELSYVAINNCHSSTLLGVTLLAQYKATPVHLSYAKFGSTIHLVSQIESLLGVDITYALVC